MAEVDYSLMPVFEDQQEFQAEVRKLDRRIHTRGEARVYVMPTVRIERIEDMRPCDSEPLSDD